MKEYLKKADLLGLVIIAAALIAYSINSVWTTYQTVAVIVGVALVVISLGLKSAEIRRGLGRRSARFGINSATSVVLFIGILAFVNYLGAQHPKRIDLTSEQIYSLSEQSIQVAEEVAEPLAIKAFYPGGNYPPDRDLLELYTNHNNNISVEFIDPDSQPQLAQQYQVSSYGNFDNPMTGSTVTYGTVILEMGGKTERIEKQSEPLREEDVTNALMKIVKGEVKTIYFTEGHGEKQLTDMERTGYQILNDELQQDNYAVKTLNLVREGKVPDDASVVIMAGPTSTPFPEEMELLDAYLNAGGSVLLLVDPAPSPGLSDFTRKWSIDVGENFVVDASGVGRLFGAGPAIPLVTNYGAHQIASSFNGMMTFFPLVRSVVPLGAPVEGVMTEELMRTNERSWGETDLASQQASMDENADLPGPVSIGVVATKTLGDDKSARLIVIGDSDFASNAYFGLQGNGNLFMNTVVWLAQDENFISIRPKDPTDRPLTMNEAQGRLVNYVSVLLLPGSILAAGISVWMKRRK